MWPVTSLREGPPESRAELAQRASGACTRTCEHFAQAFLAVPLLSSRPRLERTVPTRTALELCVRPFNVCFFFAQCSCHFARVGLDSEIFAVGPCNKYTASDMSAGTSSEHACNKLRHRAAVAPAGEQSFSPQNCSFVHLRGAARGFGLFDLVALESFLGISWQL